MQPKWSVEKKQVGKVIYSFPHMESLGLKISDHSFFLCLLLLLALQFLLIAPKIISVQGRQIYLPTPRE